MIADPEANRQEGGSAESRALKRIVLWSKHRPKWQRDALRRLFSNDELEKNDLQELLKICKGESEGIPLADKHIRIPAKGADVTLARLHNLKHVNALRPDVELSFRKTGLTIIFGDNGAGKSAFIRVLKKACRSRSRRDGDILPNIYDDENGSNPQAEIEFHIGAQKIPFSWKQDSDHDPKLTAISVFDNRSAVVHVNGENELAYAPVPLKIMASLAKACESLKIMISDEIQELEDQKPEFLNDPPWSSESASGKLLDALSANTDKNQVEVLADFTEKQRARLEQLESVLSNDCPADTASRLRSLIAQVDSAMEFMRDVDDAASDANIDRIRNLERKQNSAREAADFARTELFSAEPLPDVGSEVWRSLWESARLYSEESAYRGRPFPVTDSESRCTLCLQELTSEAAARFGRFENFIRGESGKRVRSAELAYKKAREAAADIFPAIKKLRDHVSMIRDTLKESGIAITARRSCLIGLWRLRSSLRPIEMHGDFKIPTAESAPINELSSRRKILEERVEALNDPQELAKMQAEHDDLADRKWLSEAKEEVLKYIDRLERIVELKKARGTTHTQQITMESSELTDSLVTAKLRESFEKEVGNFRPAWHKIELRRTKNASGIPYFRIQLVRKDDVRISKVFSEGEHQCVALAAFLAELATADSSSSIMFDEPAAALDHVHRRSIAMRLAEEGRERQVVIFTHDRAFVDLMREVCQPSPNRDAIPIAYRHVSRDANGAGICISWHPEHPPE